MYSFSYIYYHTNTPSTVSFYFIRFVVHLIQNERWTSTSHLTCCRLYRFSVTHYHFYTNTPFFRFVLHPHSKRNTYVNLSSFESLIRRLSHHHPQRHLYFTMTNAILSNQQNKIKLIETTAIWWSKHHSTHLSSSDRFYVALLPARKTTITFTPETTITPQSTITPHYG